MPNASAIADTPASTSTASGRLLVSLSSLSHEGLDVTIAHLVDAFPGRTVLVATPDTSAQQSSLASGTLSLLPYTPAAPSRAAWLLTAADFFNTYKLIAEQHATGCLLLGPEAQSLSVEALRALAIAIDSADLAVPQYRLGPLEGLVNSAILYPVSRALYGTFAHFPLAVDLGLSARMAERLAVTAQKFTAANQNEALLWPVADAAVAGFTVAQTPPHRRILPTPADTDLNTVLAQVAGSFFSDIEARASFWQRAHARPKATSSTLPDETHTEDAGSSNESMSAAISPMLESFRLAYTNLHEIWSLVLPPNSLLGLKKLSLLPAENFQMPDSLWARIVYDFILAYRLRTLNRGHLLGALTPLYLAWAASHLNLIASGATPSQHIEQLATAFETDKPYLVSRWRWPDRFNP